MPRNSPYDPPPAMLRLQAAAPLARVQMTTAKRHRVWLVMGFAAARAVLCDTRFSSDSRLPGFPLVREYSSLIRMDPPQHTHFRRLIAPAFSESRIRSMRGTVAQLTEGLLDEMVAVGPPADLVQHVGIPLPSLVICQLLGVPVEDRARLQELTVVALRKTSSPQEIERAVSDLGEHLATVVRAKLHEPGKDLLSWLAVEQVHAGSCSIEQAIDIARLLFVAGHVTTVNMVGLSVLMLLRHPSQARLLRENRHMVRRAVDELLRNISITGAIGRVATVDIELGGEMIRAGEGVLVSLPAANRDPHEFQDPDTFDIKRCMHRHLAFGHGPHHCLGKSLARLELEVVLDAILQRLPTLRLAVEEQDVQFRHEMRIYGVHELPVSW